MLQIDKGKSKCAVVSFNTTQEIIIQARYKASLSTNLAQYLEGTKFYSTSESHFFEVFYQSFTRPNPKS